MSTIVARPISTFRMQVDALPSLDEQIVCKFLYETAARASEAATKGVPERAMRTIKDKEGGGQHLEVRESTRPCGPRRADVSFDTYKGNEVMLVQMTILKRKLKSKDGEPLRLARIVALPIAFDPWVKDLAEYITGLQPSEPVIPYNRFELWKILVKAGMTPQNLLNAPADYRLENPLRHVRITHLVSHYGMTDEETRKFIGWAMSSPWGSRTQASYEHTNWQAYIDKLLKPLPSIEPVSLARP